MQNSIRQYYSANLAQRMSLLTDYFDKHKFLQHIPPTTHQEVTLYAGARPTLHRFLRTRYIQNSSDAGRQNRLLYEKGNVQSRVAILALVSLRCSHHRHHRHHHFIYCMSMLCKIIGSVRPTLDPGTSR